MSKSFAVWVSLCTGVAVYALVALPAWLLSSMNRSTLWCLRDHVFDARRRGHLPDAPEVDRFIRSLEQFIVVLPSVTALQLWWFRRYHLAMAKKRERPPLFQKLTDVDPTTQRYFSLLQDEFGRIVLRQYLLGSWGSIFLVVPRHWSDLRAVLRRHRDLDDWRRTMVDRQDGKDPDVGEHWRHHEVVAEVERVIPHLRKRRDKDLIAAAG